MQNNRIVRINRIVGVSDGMKRNERETTVPKIIKNSQNGKEHE